MLESNLVEGRQDIGKKDDLVYGQSITDACIGWNETEELIEMLNNAISKKKSIMKINPLRIDTSE